MADNELILHANNEFLFDTNYQSPWSSLTCSTQILDIEMFLWVLKALCSFWDFHLIFFYFYKQRKWILCTDIKPIKVYTNCLVSTLPVIHSCAWYVANTLKTHKLVCNEKYPICLNVFKTIIIQFRNTLNRLFPYLQNKIVNINFHREITVLYNWPTYTNRLEH